MAAKKRKKAVRAKSKAKRKASPAKRGSRAGKTSKASNKRTSGKTKTAAKKRVKRPAKRAAATKGKTKGEGDYAASRAFLKDQAGFVEQNRSDIPAMGKEAEAALDGPEGGDLRDAEARAAARSRDRF